MPWFSPNTVYRHVVAFMIAAILLLVMLNVWQVYQGVELYKTNTILCKSVDEMSQMLMENNVEREREVFLR